MLNINLGEYLREGIYSKDVSSCYWRPVTFILASMQHDHVQVLLNGFNLIMDLSYFGLKPLFRIWTYKNQIYLYMKIKRLQIFYTCASSK